MSDWWRNVPKFNMMNYLKELPGPISLEELQRLLVEYYTELDNEIGEIPTKYVCEDDEEDATNKEKHPENLPTDKDSM